MHVVQAPYQTFRYFKIFTLFMCVYECMSQGSDQQKEVWGAEGVSEMARWLKAPTAESDSWVLRGGMRTDVRVLAHLRSCIFIQCNTIQ